mmetsp:Transcript_33371/g.73186  ORF Transcript_33371/g.73186 Transcript_33371/m.73186 type:complete len:303 (+) Transcript_33371:1044-1952(+)
MHLPLGTVQLLLYGISQPFHHGNLEHQSLSYFHNLGNGLVVDILGILCKSIRHYTLTFDERIENAVTLVGMPLERFLRHVQLGFGRLGGFLRRGGSQGRRRRRRPSRSGAGGRSSLLPTFQQLLPLLGIYHRMSLIVEGVVVSRPQAYGVRGVGLRATLEDLLGPFRLLDAAVKELTEGPPVEGGRCQFGLVGDASGGLVGAELGQGRGAGGVGDWGRFGRRAGRRSATRRRRCSILVGLGASILRIRRPIVASTSSLFGQRLPFFPILRIICDIFLHIHALDLVCYLIGIVIFPPAIFRGR